MSLSHHTLIAWKRADDLFIKPHQLSFKAFPAIERFELGSQLRRSAFSVAVNIVEGRVGDCDPWLWVLMRCQFLGVPSSLRRPKTKYRPR